MKLSITQKEILVKLSPFKSVNGQTYLMFSRNQEVSDIFTTLLN
jgi:hypothetical protein